MAIPLSLSQKVAMVVSGFDDNQQPIAFTGLTATPMNGTIVSATVQPDGMTVEVAAQAVGSTNVVFAVGSVTQTYAVNVVSGNLTSLQVTAGLPTAQ